MPEKITATFQIVTPMFLGGASSDELADTIRPPSVKGALRFWWRALQWGRILDECGNQHEALRTLHAREARLFGLATSDKTGGQGMFLMHVTHNSLHSTAKGMVHAEFAKRDASRYLGYGLMAAFSSQNSGEKAGQLSRPCIDEGQKFSVILRSKHSLDSTMIEALIAWGLFGGLGSRARHGMGSVALQSIERNKQGIWAAPATSDQYLDEVSKLLAAARGQSKLPPYTAISTTARVDVLTNSESTPFSAMNTFATGLMMYRSWGNNGKVLGQDSEENFTPDHDWKHDIRPEGFHPRRVVFGLPHNYGKYDNLKVKPVHFERRASPLLFHVHPIGHTYMGVSIFLPAQFLPESEQINAGGANVDANIEWSIITDFLDGNRKSDGELRFAGKTTIAGSGQ